MPEYMRREGRVERSRERSPVRDHNLLDHAELVGGDAAEAGPVEVVREEPHLVPGGIFQDILLHCRRVVRRGVTFECAAVRGMDGNKKKGSGVVNSSYQKRLHPEQEPNTSTRQREWAAVKD